SYRINLTIKESTILLESMEGLIDDKIVLQEQINTAKKALTEIAGGHTVEDAIFNHQLIASKALAAIGGDDE
ncbi:hypothetical protein ACWOAM_08650, partial [Lactococcus hircilactis]